MDKLIKRMFVILTTITMVFSSIPFAYADDNGIDSIDSNEFVVEEVTDEIEADIEADAEMTDSKEESSDITDRTVEESEPESSDVIDVDQEEEDTETIEEPDTNVPYDTGSEAKEEEMTKAADPDHEHSDGVWNIEPATFDTDGRRKKICSDCAEVLEEKPIYMVSDVIFDNEAAAYVYDGKEIIPTVTVRDSQGNLLTEDVDYIIEFANNDKIGKAKATITLQGENYSGKKDFTFSILNGELKRTNLIVGDSKTVAIDTTITKLLGNDFIYSIADESVATADANGKVTGVAAGKTILTVESGGVIFRSDVTVIEKQSEELVVSGKYIKESTYGSNFSYKFTYDGLSTYRVVLNGAGLDCWEYYSDYYDGYSPDYTQKRNADLEVFGPEPDEITESFYRGVGDITLDPNLLEAGQNYSVYITTDDFDYYEEDDEYMGRDDVYYLYDCIKPFVNISLYKVSIPKSLAFDETSYDLTIGDKKTLEYTTSDTTRACIKWKSSDTSVATVKKGTVTAKKPGKCTITATLPNGYTDQCTINVSQYTDLTFTSKSAKIYGLSSKQLSLVNQNYIYDKITWKSSNTKVATVDSNGKVTAKKGGTVTITASVVAINKSTTCKVTVVPKIKSKTVKIYLKKSYSNKLIAAPEKVKWSSSNKKVATVSSKGKITGKTPGTCTITAKCKGKKYTCKVTVKPIKLSYTSANIYRGQSFKIKVTGGSGKIKWKTSNSKVATVSSKGVVKGVEPGKCIISMTRNGYTKKCKVKVARREPDFGAVLDDYNTRNNYFVVCFHNAGSKTLTITSGIKVEDDDYKSYDRSISLKKQIKIKPRKTKYVRFYVKGRTTWYDYRDFSLFYKFKYDGKTYTACVWYNNSVFKDGSIWDETYWDEDWYYEWY